jgi:hypothetical protein
LHDGHDHSLDCIHAAAIPDVVMRPALVTEARRFGNARFGAARTPVLRATLDARIGAGPIFMA